MIFLIRNWGSVSRSGPKLIRSLSGSLPQDRPRTASGFPVQRRAQPQDRHVRSTTLPGAPGRVEFRAPDEFGLEGTPKPKIQRGPSPQKGNLLYGPPLYGQGEEAAFDWDVQSRAAWFSKLHGRIAHLHTVALYTWIFYTWFVGRPEIDDF